MGAYRRPCAIVLALAFTGCDVGRDDVEDVLEVAVSEASGEQGSSFSLVPTARSPNVNLDAVRWTTPKKESIKQLGKRWGVSTEDLIGLNPDLQGLKNVAAGQELVVYRHQADAVSRSVGTPNRGRLENGIPFPEGDHWQLRAFRHRTYATQTVVETLAAVLDSRGREFPGADPIFLGEFSRRSGGKVPPHSSHRSGRDVDVGYALIGGDKHGLRWKSANADNFDAEQNWFIIRGLLESGAVERIYMAKSLQRLMLPFALADLDPAAVPHWFSIAAPDARAKKKALIGYWRGHDDHMHVRFACTPVDISCREPPPKRRKKKKKKGKKKKKKKRKR